MTNTQLPPLTEHPVGSDLGELEWFPSQLTESLREVFDTVAPVWPLKDYVAVNPYFGSNHRSFMDVRARLRVFSECEMLMPVAYYADQYQQGRFGREDIASAVAELAECGVKTPLPVEQIIDQLRLEITVPTTLDQPAPEPNRDRLIRTIAETIMAPTSVNWPEAIRDEVSKYCGAHYDDGQASWTSPWKQLSLYEAWRTGAVRDRSMESLGVSGFRDRVSRLPLAPEVAILHSLQRLKVPPPLWTAFLLCQAYSVPGWSAWAKYQDAECGAVDGNDFAGLLAMRLAYDVALSEAFAIELNWNQFVRDGDVCFPPLPETSVADGVLRQILLRASEIGFRNELIRSFAPQQIEINLPSETTPPERASAQLVFCIDVRSERLRRHIEAVNEKIQTFGFAGFFAMPVAFTALGQTDAVSHLPVLLKPQFQVQQTVLADDQAVLQLTTQEQEICRQRVTVRSWRKFWRGLQTSAVGCFSFVETTGIFFGYHLFRRLLGARPPLSDSAYDGLTDAQQQQFGPVFRGLAEQGISLSKQVDLAHGMLTNLGLVNDFARLVVFCGHASQTDNNPLAAGLDCGACGGHSGEPNARLAALILNQPQIRAALAERGIQIPSDTHFVGAVHNTTIDEIQFFDGHQVPPTHQHDLLQLKQDVSLAGARTCQERLPILAGQTPADVMRRSRDWSEVRPEWGLAGNAAFIVAPRRLTQAANLDGRSFLHSYDHRLDPTGSVLETIMTAPMVVANWINMQYYASTVDNHHFGSGNKTVHNVIGRFGVLSGNGGDLQTGLPWQSLHTGDKYQHWPLRLQVVIAAPRDSIQRVIDKHTLVSNLITNGWLHLIAIDGPDMFRFSAAKNWEPLDGLCRSSRLGKVRAGNPG
jgi:uncharacterized protein YbcC (UPF0753/DUF2309 family)